MVGTQGLTQWELGAPGLVALVSLASALFVVAGALRLAKWRLAGDAHSALVGTALVTMGALCLPLGALSFLAAPESLAVELVEPVLRATFSSVAVVLLIRSVPAPTPGGWTEPRRCLAALVVVAVMLLSAAALLGRQAPEFAAPAPLGPVLSAFLVLAWCGVVVVALRRGVGTPWARWAGWIYGCLAVAEVSHAVEPGYRGPGTVTALLLYAVAGVLAVRAAHLDHARGVAAEQERIARLVQALARASERAVELRQWREHLVHDARNSMAGLRAALTVLESVSVPDDDPGTAVTARLRTAAVEEVLHLERLLAGSPALPAYALDVEEVLR